MRCRIDYAMVLLWRASKHSGGLHIQDVSLSRLTCQHLDSMRHGRSGLSSDCCLLQVMVKFPIEFWKPDLGSQNSRLINPSGLRWKQAVVL